MHIDLRAVLFAMAMLVVMAASKETEEKSKIEKRDTEEPELHTFDDEESEAEKRRNMIFRYGRGALFRYGKRGTMPFRYGKRGALPFRYGKRGALPFRYGKRNDELPNDLDSTKRLFRWGKRADEDADFSRVFRWGKRDGEEDVYDTNEVLDGDMEDDKRRAGLFRYGKRDADLDALLEEAKRIFRYGRDIRAPQGPHVPFRFGDEE